MREWLRYRPRSVNCLESTSWNQSKDHHLSFWLLNGQERCKRARIAHCTFRMEQSNQKGDAEPFAYMESAGPSD